MTAPLTDEEIATLRALLGKMTPNIGASRSEPGSSRWVLTVDGNEVTGLLECDAVALIALVNAAPQLLDMLDETQEALNAETMARRFLRDQLAERGTDTVEAYRTLVALAKTWDETEKALARQYVNYPSFQEPPAGFRERADELSRAKDVAWKALKDALLVAGERGTGQPETPCPGLLEVRPRMGHREHCPGCAGKGGTHG